MRHPAKKRIRWLVLGLSLGLLFMGLLRASTAYPDGLERTFGDFIENPRVKICGCLFHYRERTPKDFRHSILNRVLSQMESTQDKVFGDTLNGYLRLWQCGNLPDDARNRLGKKLERMIPVSIETDCTKWEEYCLKPVGAIKSPDSPFLYLIEKAMGESLDYEIRKQNRDGSWKPFWSWGDSYPDDWAVAKQEWSAILALDMLKVLEAFGRIEG